MSEKVQKQTFTTKLYEVCANDELRPVMQCIHFIDGYAYAADGYIGIKQTLELHSILGKENLEGKSIHRDSYKAIMGFEIAEANAEGIYCKSATGQSAFFDYFPTEQMPNFGAYFAVKGQTTLSFIGINPELVTRLSKAMYNPSDNMRLQFTGIDKHIIIDCPGVDGQEARLMPRILESSLF